MRSSISRSPMHPPAPFRLLRAWPLYLGMLLAACVYWPGLSGGWLFDDYPNIVDNHGVHPNHASVASLTAAALSSPASEFKRPLSSLTFAANYLASGLDPFWMKATNLAIHLLNGLLAFALSRRLIRCARRGPDEAQNEIMIAGVIAAAWLLLPINLTAVLYVVQRMESLANLFVLTGLLGYVTGRQRMLAGDVHRGLATSAGSLVAATVIGLTAKETAVMLPLYAALTEWFLFHFRDRDGRISRSVAALFGITLVLPMIAGLAWLLPDLLRADTWAARDFTMGTRLLSEARIIVDYVVWILIPTPGSLTFYHDDFTASSGVFQPWTTLPSILLLTSLIWLSIGLRRRAPLASLGIALYLGCHVLTGTILPLELIYEHRNYFASFGLLLGLIPPLLALPPTTTFAWVRNTLLGALMIWWVALTASTSFAWGDPLRLAKELAARGPNSPRAQYELGRTYIIDSHYDPQSRFAQLAYAPLERAMDMPSSSILPEQALIFMNARMHLPLKGAWWTSMIAKLAARRPGIQDESSLEALVNCTRSGSCDLPKDRMTEAFDAAMSHPGPSARLMAIYGDYAWNELGNYARGLRLLQSAAQESPNEPAYLITLVRMLATQGNREEAERAIARLQRLNVGGRLDGTLKKLREMPALQ